MKQIYSQPPSNLGRNHTTTTPYCTWIAIDVVMWLLVAPVVANTTRYSNDNAPCMTTDTEDNNLTEGINFLTGTWDHTVAVANHVRMPIFVYLFMPGVPDCKTMQTDVLRNNEVGALYNTRFICHKMNIHSAEGMKFKNRYAIDQYPTLLYFTHTGALINRAHGHKNAEEMKLLCTQFLILINCSATSATPMAVSYSGYTPANIQMVSPPLHDEKMKKLLDYQILYENGNLSPAFLYEYAYILKDFSMPNAYVVNQYLDLVSADLEAIEKNAQFVLDFATEVNTDAFAWLFTYQPTYATLVGENVVNQTLFKAMRYSINKAASLQDKAEYNSVMEILKQWDNPKSAIYQIELNELYYRTQGKWEDYSQMMLGKLTKAAYTQPDLLNRTAQNFAIHIQDKHMLENALKWVKAAIRQQPHNYNYYQTYAALQYRLGNNKKALVICSKAIKLAQKSGGSIDYTAALYLEDLIKSNKQLPSDFFEY